MADAEPFDVTVTSGITIAMFRPGFAQIDEPVMDIVNRKLVDLVAELPAPMLVLDLSEVDFFGSSFIETMFRVWKRLQSRPGARFALCGLKPYCREVLEVTHLDRLWTLYSTRDEALAQLKTA